MSQDRPSQDSPEAPRNPRGLRSRVLRAWPRPETTLLIVSVVGTVAVKYLNAKTMTSWPVEGGHGPASLMGDVLEASCADVVFFAAVAALFALGYVVSPTKLFARLTLLVAAVLGAWSVVNAGWLVATGSQMQPSVLVLAARDYQITLEVLLDTFAVTMHRITLPLIFIAVCLVWYLWRLYRPVPVVESRRHHAMRMLVALGAIVVATALGRLDLGTASTAAWKDAIRFNSHWYALMHTMSDLAESDETAVMTRVIPRAGERAIEMPTTPPGAPPSSPPNVVVIFLESVSHPVTTLGDPTLGTTPTLARLAGEGVEFVRTRTMMPETTKAWWASLTSTRPDFLAGAVESVLVDEPYESLATILARRGYRSAFFEMSRGPWFGAPGLWANIGYDWAWFRENLEDESAYLGIVNGDDFRMIEPMFEWVDGGEEPFLLTMITTVTHDPYDLPEWYEHEPTDDIYEKYLQTIRFSDAFVEEVFTQLERRGLTENTLLCVIGDHGEVFRPDARRGRLVVYEELIRVPWVIWWPGRIEAGTKITWPCSQLDMTPTILSLLGFGIDEAGFEGVNALEPIDADRRLFFASWLGKSPKGYVEDDRKYVYFPYTKKLLLYDLANDPRELSPRAVEGSDLDAIVDTITTWERESYIDFPPHRYRERMLFDHWRTFSTGRSTNAYYVP
ncbi:MAG: LTA synthase family protein [Planctomycetes bacterium]|nr:LTA synthase family protein [Planctomycetota bacterium]